MSHDLGTLQEEQPRGLLLVCETLLLFLGFYIEKMLCCEYLALLHDIKNLDTDAAMHREPGQGL